MEKRCTICTHENLAEIDRDLMAGMPLRQLAAHYGISPSALSRHTKHLRRALEAADHENHQAHQNALLDKLNLLEFRLERIYQKAQESHSLSISLGCVQEVLRIFNLREKIRQSLSGKF
ncbi:MAG: hypothetical protein ACOZFS_03900 [Thermodesulfobacteriota bacterium]